MPDFDLRSLEKLLHDFYNLTRMKTCLYDSQGNELLYYPTRLSAVCEILREDGEIDKRCRACDKQAFATCRNTRNQYVYTCHAGLRECVSPILCDDRIVGFIMIGQIKGPQRADFAAFEKSLAEDVRTRVRAAYRRLPSIPSEKLVSACHILDACAGYGHLRTLLQNYKNSIDSQIDRYIHQNLTGTLSVPVLCSEFHLSRHELYRICDQYFGSAPAEYIKKCRLTHACYLLTATALPIHEIAARCGIPDYNYFSKVFKSAFGMSPTAYRRKPRSQNEP